MGGIEALGTLVAQLPADLPASILIVQHVSEGSPGVLGEILSRRGPLPAVTAEDGMAMERGRIYVAAPGRHMLATERGVRVVFGPRENRSRPAIDPLFRTAAVNFRSRVIGVVLTGLLGDGAAGLHAIARCGGTAIVQSPDDAFCPEMPRRALERVPGAHVAALGQLGELLDRLAREQAGPAPEVPEGLSIEVRMTERAMVTDDWNQTPGLPTRFTCPECVGALQEIEEDGQSRYRCRVGHAYSPDDLVAQKSQALEETLWMALQTLEERAEMLATMARDDRTRGWARTAGGYDDRAREAWVHAERLRDLLKTLSA